MKLQVCVKIIKIRPETENLVTDKWNLTFTAYL